MASTHRRASEGFSESSAPWPAPHLSLVSDAATTVEPEPSTASGPQAFCARLKAVRERRGITLAAISQSTKVNASLYAALERGDLSHWPPGIYRRAFFRGFVVAIGLPPDSTLEEFVRHFPDQGTAAVADRLPTDDLTLPAPAFEDEGKLRLTLAGGGSGALSLPALRKSALIDAVVVLLAALVLLWGTGASVWTGVGVVGLCCYPQIARAFRRRMRGGRLSALLRSRQAALRTTIQPHHLNAQCSMPDGHIADHRSHITNQPCDGPRGVSSGQRAVWADLERSALYVWSKGQALVAAARRRACRQ